MNDNENFALFKSKRAKVKKAWIDYNGHMNVAYYTLAFDKAIDEFLEKVLSIGPSFIKKSGQGSYALQTQYLYLRELLQNSTFEVSILVVDFTPKRMHLMAKMIESVDQEVCATCETIMVNVDLKERKSCQYPSSVLKKLINLYNAAERVRSKTLIGQPIGLRHHGKN